MTARCLGRNAALALATLAFVPAGHSAVPDWVAAAPSRTAQTADEGLVVRATTAITLDTDGKLTRHEEQAIKLYTPWVIGRGYFDPNLSWNDARATLTVDQARTYTTDGRTVDAKANSFVANTPHALEWATPYAHLRTMTVAQVGVETNGTTVLAWTVADRAPSGVPVWGAIELAGPLPVREQNITVAVPEGTEIAWSGLGCDLPVALETRGGRRQIVLARRDVAAVNAGESATSGTGYCRLLYSTAHDWAAARTFLESRVAPALRADAAVTAKAKEIAGRAVLDDERIAKVHAFVVDGVQTIRWPFDAVDYAARPAADVLQSSVGHALDKAVLLASMLRALGYDAQVALVRSERGPAPATPVPALFDEAWVRVAQGDAMLWLDPTRAADKHGAAHLAGHAVLPLDGRTAAPIVLPALTPAGNRAALRLALALEDGGSDLRVSGQAELDLAGLYNAAPTYDREGDGVAALATSAVRSVGKSKAAQVVVLERSRRATALRAKVEGGSVSAGRNVAGPVTITLPRVPGAVSSDALQLWRGRRSQPLALPGPAEERVELALTIPEGFGVVYQPAPVSIDNAAGTFDREVTRDGRTVTVRTTLLLKAADVGAEEYVALRTLMAEQDGEAGRVIVLQRN